MQWNNHPLSSEHGQTPFQMWTRGFYKYALSDYTTVREVLETNSVDSDYGVDDDAPLPEIQTENFVEIPRSTIELTDDELHIIASSLDPLDNDDDHGISSYQQAQNILRGLNQTQ